MSSANDPCIRGNIIVKVGQPALGTVDRYTSETVNLHGREDYERSAREPWELLEAGSGAYIAWHTTREGMRCCRFVPANPEYRNTWYELATKALLSEEVSRA